MRVRSRPPAVALCLLAMAPASGGCGGGGAVATHSGTGGAQATSRPATVDTSPRPPPPASAARPHAHVPRRIAREIVQVGGRRVRVDAATVTCGGEGRSSGRGRERRWASFTCIQPTFNGTETAGPDVLFRVQPTGRRSFRITDQRLTRY